MDIFGNKEGSYFRASMWEWKAVCFAIELSGYKIPIEWHKNYGAGLNTQLECDELADALAVFLRKYQAETIVKESDSIHIDENGRLVTPSKNTRSPYEITREFLESFIEFLKVCDGFKIW